MSFTAANHVGRLIELRVAPPLTRQEAESWLGEVLNGAERARLRAFLDESKSG
ncbi:MAG: hypothetical protein JWM53_6515 [bacterium]|nr:hypothetical protein [bacterium]